MEQVIEPFKKLLTFVLWGKLGEPQEVKTEFGIAIVQKDTRFMLWHLLAIILVVALFKNLVFNLFSNAFSLLKTKK